MTPFNRFAAHLEMIREAPADLTDHFRKEVRRRVSKDRSSPSTDDSSKPRFN
ncbi:MAG: hypothetical protein JKP90_06425 [Desulfofustis sp. PB-SRB1]|nr:hypothetical protein [Desulfofustis sp. PB-SRB1]